MNCTQFDYSCRLLSLPDCKMDGYTSYLAVKLVAEGSNWRLSLEDLGKH